jgi:hypothetical protein
VSGAHRTHAHHGGAKSLRADHDDLERLAEVVIAGLAAGDRAEAAAAIGLLQSSVVTHLDGEERELIGVYARHSPDGAAAIREDHAAIRKALADLDVTTDLHLLRVDAIRDLLQKLRAQAAREDRGMYRWLLASWSSKPAEHHPLHEAGGAAIGALAGAALGSVAGPPGVAAGAVVGAVVGQFVAKLSDEEEARASFHDKERDAIIGMSGGELGAPNLKHPPATRGTYSAASSGGASSGGDSSASGRMQTPGD